MRPDSKSKGTDSSSGVGPSCIGPTWRVILTPPTGLSRKRTYDSRLTKGFEIMADE